MRYSTLLERFKEESVEEDALSVLIDVDMIPLILAWPKIKVTWSPPTFVEEDELPDHDVDCWEMLWKYCSWDLEDLCQIVNGTNVSVMSRFMRLVKLRLLFPDGTISEEVMGLLSRYLRKQMDLEEDEYEEYEDEGDEDIPEGHDTGYFMFELKRKKYRH